MPGADSWERVSSDQVADCRVFNVRRHECRRTGDGKPADFFVIDSPDWVNIIPITAAGDIVMIEQFRHGTEEIRFELPGGLIDDGDTPQASAARELLEETGYSSRQWVLIGSSRPNPALQGNTIYHYVALDCEKIAEPALDPNESIAVRFVPEAETEKMIEDGTVTHSLVVAAFLYLRFFRARQDENTVS